MRIAPTPAGIGSNSAAYGQTLINDLETVLGGDDKVTFHYVRWHIGDYLSGTKEMGLEIEGAYIRFLTNLYERGKPFPDDDRLMANVMRLSVRVWRRIRDGLISLGKILARNGCLTNCRFEKERQKRAEEMRKKAAAADARWSGNPKTSAKLPANLGKTSAKLPANYAEKTNEINDTQQKVHGVTNSQKPIANIEDNSRLPDSELSRRLEQAAGACLKNPAASPGLLVLSEPRRWLEQGCDLEIDVLPAIRAVASKRPLRSVGGWSYFTTAIIEARAKRTTPLPRGDTEAVIEAKRIEREKMIRSRAGILGMTPDEYRERLEKAAAQ